jgi:hypothetical protein
MEIRAKPYFEDGRRLPRPRGRPGRLPAAQNLGKLLYGLDDDYEHEAAGEPLPAQVRLLRRGAAAHPQADKKLIDGEGNLVDEKGRLVNEAGELVDHEGTPLTEDGDYKVEFAEFVDDEAAAAAPARPSRVSGRSPPRTA